MNKYEKALADVANETVDRLADGYYQPKTVEHFHSSAINILRELVERATSMQPEFNYDEDTYECPCCGKTYETYYDGYLKKFCNDCGQALDWRVEDGKTMHN